ncbi:hypothetical protein LCGC14_2851160, partial [marine sediment metagenome]
MKSDKITTTNRIKLLWIICSITFFFSAALDNLTTAIVMAALLRKLLKEREVLFDDDRNGIPFDGQDSSATSDAYGCNFSLIGAGTPVLLDSAVQVIGDPLLFDPAIVFTEGAELNVYLT